MFLVSIAEWTNIFSSVHRSDEDARLAMRKTGNILKGIQITLFLSSRSEMQKVIETARQQAMAQHFGAAAAASPAAASSTPAVAPPAQTNIPAPSFVNTAPPPQTSGVTAEPTNSSYRTDAYAGATSFGANPGYGSSQYLQTQQPPPVLKQAEQKMDKAVSSASQQLPPPVWGQKVPESPGYSGTPGTGGYDWYRQQRHSDSNPPPSVPPTLKPNVDPRTERMSRQAPPPQSEPPVVNSDPRRPPVSTQPPQKALPPYQQAPSFGQYGYDMASFAPQFKQSQHQSSGYSIAPPNAIIPQTSQKQSHSLHEGASTKPSNSVSSESSSGKSSYSTSSEKKDGGKVSSSRDRDRVKDKPSSSSSKDSRDKDSDRDRESRRRRSRSRSREYDRRRRHRSRSRSRDRSSRRRHSRSKERSERSRDKVQEKPRSLGKEKSERKVSPASTPSAVAALLPPLFSQSTKNSGATLPGLGEIPRELPKELPTTILGAPASQEMITSDMYKQTQPKNSGMSPMEQLWPGMSEAQNSIKNSSRWGGSPPADQKSNRQQGYGNPLNVGDGFPPVKSFPEGGGDIRPPGHFIGDRKGENERSEGSEWSNRPTRDVHAPWPQERDGRVALPDEPHRVPPGHPGNMYVDSQRFRDDDRGKNVNEPDWFDNEELNRSSGFDQKVVRSGPTEFHNRPPFPDALNKGAFGGTDARDFPNSQNRDPRFGHQDEKFATGDSHLNDPREERKQKSFNQFEGPGSPRHFNEASSRFDGSPSDRPGRFDGPPERLNRLDRPFARNSRFDGTIDSPNRFDGPTDRSGRFDEPSDHSSRFDGPPNRSSRFEEGEMRDRFEGPGNRPNRMEEQDGPHSRYNAPPGRAGSFEKTPDFPNQMGRPNGRGDRFSENEMLNEISDGPGNFSDSDGNPPRFDGPDGRPLSRFGGGDGRIVGPEGRTGILDAPPANERGRPGFGRFGRGFRGGNELDTHSRYPEARFEADGRPSPPPMRGRRGGIRGGRGGFDNAGPNFKPHDGPTQTCSVEILNLHNSVPYGTIKAFFKPLYVPKDAIKLLGDEHGNRIGVALVRFQNAKDAVFATTYSERQLHRCNLQIKLIDEEVYDKYEDISARNLPPRGGLVPPPIKLMPSDWVHILGMPFGKVEEDVLEVLRDHNVKDIVKEFNAFKKPTGGFFARLSCPEEAADVSINSAGLMCNDIPLRFVHVMPHIVREAAPIELQRTQPLDCQARGPPRKEPVQDLSPDIQEDEFHYQEVDFGGKQDFPSSNNSENPAPENNFGGKRPMEDKQDAEDPRPAKRASNQKDLLTDSISITGSLNNVSESDIRDFFSDIGLVPENVYFVQSQSNDDKKVFVVFSKISQAKEALQKSNQYLGQNPVTISLVAKPVVMNTVGLPFDPLDLIRKGKNDSSSEDKSDSKMNPSRPVIEEPEENGRKGPVRLIRQPMRQKTDSNYEQQTEVPKAIGCKGEVIPEMFGQPGCVVAFANVPLRATTEDIINFMKDDFAYVTPEHVIRRYDEHNRPTSDARVSFKSRQDATRALDILHNKPMLNRPIYVSLV